MFVWLQVRILIHVTFAEVFDSTRLLYRCEFVVTYVCDNSYGMCRERSCIMLEVVTL